MKQLLSLLFFAILIPLSHAQKGLNVGANFMALNTNIVNQNTWGNGREYDYSVTFNTSFGIDVGYGISDHMGIYTGYWFTTLGQDYKDSYSGSEWERKLELKYNMIPVMLKFNGTESKVNFLGGVGVVFASLKEANQEWLRDGEAYSQNITVGGKTFDLGATDVTDRFAKSDIMINLDLGARILLGEKLFLDVTANFGYGFKDINAEDWQIVNGSGEYDPSHNAFGGLKVGLAYKLFGN
ncbi:MAG: outer membrane beta-barrel protein [Saprospiraceae bacterium]|nr:outer membrane beta-barrel protein [Candidatus Opimibacter iunctus]